MRVRRNFLGAHLDEFPPLALSFTLSFTRLFRRAFRYAAAVLVWMNADSNDNLSTIDLDHVQYGFLTLQKCY